MTMVTVKGKRAIFSTSYRQCKLLFSCPVFFSFLVYLWYSAQELVAKQQQEYNQRVSHVQENMPSNENNLLEKINSEWSDAFIPSKLKLNSTIIAQSLEYIGVHVPGADGIREELKIPFFKKTPPWLSKRTFTSKIFFCPPNGHEGTITNLIGQLLSQAKDKSSKNQNGFSFMDVGSNLGFYSLMAIHMGIDAYAFDIQPFCLYNLQSLAKQGALVNDEGDVPLLHTYNVGMSDRESVVTNAEGGCDYENFYVADDSARLDKVFDDTKAGIGVKVPIVRMDHWVQQMGGRLKGPIQVLKMDTEGAEGRIVLGMSKTLESCLVRNWIVELTLAHWYRFDQAIDDPVAIGAFVDVVEKHSFKAYLMFTDTPRRPPESMHDFIQPLESHPNVPGEKGTGCFGAPYFAILDMRRFIHEYCLDFADTVTRPGNMTARGFCGNIWFQKQGCD